MIPALILVASAIVHFIKVGTPMSVVFDEVYYGDFISNYWHGSYFFDIHPPFVKLFFAFTGLITGANNYSANWSAIGNALPSSIIHLRVIPIIAGIFLPLIIYALCRRLNFSKLASFLASSLLCLENSIIVQSRFLLPDIIMILVGFGAIWLYFEYISHKEHPRSFWILAGSAILAAIALSIKWTGLTFLFLILIMETYRLLKISGSIKKWFRYDLRKLLDISIIYISIALFTYAILFAVHFSALPYSGKGDVFMSVEFQKGLIGNTNNTNANSGRETFSKKFFELNRIMYTANSEMLATHSYSSKWYTWPLMYRSVFYWQGSEPTPDSPRSYIYFLGNPVIYWLGSLVMLGLIILVLTKGITRKPLSSNTKNSKIILFIITGYLVNLLPFILIGRVMFLYHYMTSLIFSIIAIAFVTDQFKRAGKITLTIIIITIAFIAFLYWSPLTYGTPLTDNELSARMWLPSWR